MAARASGLQRDVLHLYRDLLRAAKLKGGPSTARFVREEFREKAFNVQKNDFKKIEHLLRYGTKQKKLFEMPGFSGTKFFSVYTYFKLSHIYSFIHTH